MEGVKLFSFPIEKHSKNKCFENRCLCVPTNVYFTPDVFEPVEAWIRQCYPPLIVQCCSSIPGHLRPEVGETVHFLHHAYAVSHSQPLAIPASILPFLFSPLAWLLFSACGLPLMSVEAGLLHNYCAPVVSQSPLSDAYALSVYRPPHYAVIDHYKLKSRHAKFLLHTSNHRESRYCLFCQSLPL